ncbi:sulfite exporter TauE/SafE family protein [Neobacillus sp. OS1-2]|uniref:urease accessory protein UreH domain-containing protein n=1 Tax=Neobacillus sp. OS1-2 TaxID=3070680 RepID=UPI0027E17D57|nr:sulfite exporter TauE/SafE family protein [Neobacillus sp. OS1-2]WML40528.1 sulfite exporter TauE/SafE family protein [Neobacillus sp. OS1-2]
MGIRKERIKVYDMTCTSCEKRIERTVKKINGVIEVKANFTGQFADVVFNEESCSRDQIKAAINRIGYSTENGKGFKVIGIIMVVAAIFLFGINTGSFNMEDKLKNASYAVLFVFGVITSLHCVGMCGGIMLSQTIGKESKNKFEAMKPAILYNLGRVTAYTIIGGIVGAIGSVFALSLTTKSIMQILAGVFMVMMGFNMAGFKAFRKVQFKLPSSAIKMLTKSKPKTPFFIGMLNGLMPCGPLQTLQLYALGTGSAISGALSMFMFAIGTVPLMLTFGAVSSLLSKGYTKKILKFSGILIVVLGLVMSNRGLALVGMNFSPGSMLANMITSGDDSASAATATKATIKDGIQVLHMTANVYGYTPNTLYVQKGMPVKWVVEGEQITGCNSTIVVPDINVEQKLQSGNNIIEFTPGNEDIPFSCWMGMKQGVIKVVDDLKKVKTASSGAKGMDSSTNSTASASNQTKPSIYGTDISLVPTERLVQTIQLSNNEQSIAIKGIGYELEPLIIVANQALKTKMSIDLTSFDQPNGAFITMNANTKQIVTEFTGAKEIVDIEFSIEKAGTYGIYLNEEELLGIIDVVKDVNSVDLEDMRSKYIQ